MGCILYEARESLPGGLVVAFPLDAELNCVPVFDTRDFVARNGVHSIPTAVSRFAGNFLGPVDVQIRNILGFTRSVFGTTPRTGSCRLIALLLGCCLFPAQLGPLVLL